MRCKKCGHNWRLHSHGLGSSDPPGGFLRLLGLFLAVGSVAAYFAYYGSMIGIAVVVFCGLSSICTLGAVLTGMIDQRAYNGPNCPECGERVDEIWPWSE